MHFPVKSLKNKELSFEIPQKKSMENQPRFRPFPARRRGDGQRRPGRGRGRGHSAAHGEDQDEGAESCEK